MQVWGIVNVGNRPYSWSLNEAGIYLEECRDDRIVLGAMLPSIQVLYQPIMHTARDGKLGQLLDKCKMSKAFEKSNPIKCTYSWFCKSKVIVFKRLIRAAVVEPVGLNANWSLNKLEWSLCIRTGYKNLVMINFSRSRHRIDVTEMGRKSAHTFGWLDFGTGVI